MHVPPETITNIVALDGPAGAGKSTVARRVAAKLGYAFLDTGAMYRAATWNAMQLGLDWDDPESLAQATRAMQLNLVECENGVQVFVNGTDISDAIRTPEVTRCIAMLDSNAQVREHLVELQRKIGARKPTVAEGRDMGTVVFPAARCKIYLDASIDQRFRRRAQDFDARGISYDPATLREEILVRDQKDMTRAVAPLRRAPDAILLDTSNLSAEEVIDRIVNLARSTC